MSLFRIVKYSSLIYFLGRHRNKLFRSAALLIFAFVTSLLYEDLRHYLELRHPGTLIYALVAKIIIVYGSLAIVLWQFRPGTKKTTDTESAATVKIDAAQAPRDRLDALTDVDAHKRLRNRYDRILDREESVKNTSTEKTGH